MKYQFARLTEAAHIASYRSECKARIGVEFPDDYVARSQIYGLFDGEKLLGGALLCVEGPFRSIIGIPEPQRTAILATLSDSVFEGSGLWLDRKISSPSWCFYFYFCLCLAVMRSGKKYGLFTYATSIRALNELYDLGATEILYEGPVFCSGMKAPENERVCLSPVSKASAMFLFSPVVAPLWFARRVLRRRLRARTVLARQPA